MKQPVDINYMKFHFRKCGTVEEIMVFQQGRGYVFIEFHKLEAVSAALEMNGTFYQGSFLRVNAIKLSNTGVVYARRLLFLYIFYARLVPNRCFRPKKACNLVIKLQEHTITKKKKTIVLDQMT